MQQGTDHWRAAGWLDMTIEQFETNYGPHHPDCQGEVAMAFSGKAILYRRQPPDAAPSRSQEQWQPPPWSNGLWLQRICYIARPVRPAACCVPRIQILDRI